MAAQIIGVVFVVIFYILIMAVGIISGRMTSKNRTSESLFVANRNINFAVACVSVTASVVGGAFINGTAEETAFKGIVWSQAMVFYPLSMLLAGIFYAGKMRREGYITVFDPFQIAYGRKIGGLMFIPQLFAGLFWGAAILAALGSTLSVILDIDSLLAMLVSAAVAIIYTFFGGLYAVAYTDILQLLFVAVGLVLAIPFAWSHHAVDTKFLNGTWTGKVETAEISQYIDVSLLLLLGGIPFQEVWQRILACRTTTQAIWAPIIGCFGELTFGGLSAAIGIIGASTDWGNTTYTGVIPIPEEQQPFILPMVLQHLCPLPVTVIGLGAIAAAVMSSADSIVLASGTVFAYNIYKLIIRPQATGNEIAWVLKISIVAVGVLATLIAAVVKSVYGLLVISGDLMYIIVFPQLTCVLWLDNLNGYGCVTSFVLSLVLRICAGDDVLGIPAWIKFPYYDDSKGQLAPFRTIIMLIGAFVLVAVSWLTNALFRRDGFFTRLDVLDLKNAKEHTRRRYNRISRRHKKQEQETNGKTLDVITQND